MSKKVAMTAFWMAPRSLWSQWMWKVRPTPLQPGLEHATFSNRKARWPLGDTQKIHSLWSVMSARWHFMKRWEFDYQIILTVYDPSHTYWQLNRCSFTFNSPCPWLGRNVLDLREEMTLFLEEKPFILQFSLNKNVVLSFSTTFNWHLHLFIQSRPTEDLCCNVANVSISPYMYTKTDKLLSIRIW